MKVKSESEVAQSCPTLSDPVNCRPPGSSVHGMFQARVLEWVAIAFSGRGRGKVQNTGFKKNKLGWGQGRPATGARLHSRCSVPTISPNLMQRSLVGCSRWGLEELDPTERFHFHFSLSCVGEGNGNPLQCSCLENPRDEGAWWAAVSGVTQSRTRLMRLSTNSNHVPVTGLIALHALSHRSLKTTHEFGFIIILILHMTKLRLQEINTGHIASK